MTFDAGHREQRVRFIIPEKGAGTVVVDISRGIALRTVATQATDGSNRFRTHQTGMESIDGNALFLPSELPKAFLRNFIPYLLELPQSRKARKH